MVAVPSDAVSSLYPDTVGPDDFVTWTAWVMSRFGFRPTNALPLVAVCRDELMLPFQDAVHGVWGPSFDASSLAAVPYLGRTGISAALGHAPGEDGRHRFVVFAFPHIGVDGDGLVGQVRRRGIRRSTTACGALVALRGEVEPGGVLAAPTAVGWGGTALDPDDVEMHLLRGRVGAALAGEPMPTLVGLTELVRREAAAMLERLVAGLNRTGRPVDHAMFSGVVVHTDDGDVVAPAAASVVIDGRRRRLLADAG